MPCKRNNSERHRKQPKLSMVTVLALSTPTTRLLCYGNASKVTPGLLSLGMSFTSAPGVQCAFTPP
ncbi:MAG TPA: hypothetical protein VM577_20305, partial [Anaerovoracaceae bacterium]|nr:hypothetical protein [Anaerovoracaceae bacterium]